MTTDQARTTGELASQAAAVKPRTTIPFRDPRFWVIQVLILGIDVGHTLLEDADLLVGDTELYLLSISVFLIPVVYAAMSFGMRGAVPTVLWALVLSLPEIRHHDQTTRAGILIQFAIIFGIAVIVALRVDRERAAARATERANRQLVRLNATASAAAVSLDRDTVIRSTMHAMVDPQQEQVGWICLLGDGWAAPRTDIVVSAGAAPSGLTADQERLTKQACTSGHPATDGTSGGAVHTVTAPLWADDRLVGAIGLSQPAEALHADDRQVLESMAKQLSVALDNSALHSRNSEALVALRTANENLQTYVALATDAQEEERKRLSRELHDDILQSLVVAKGQLESAEKAARGDVVGERLAAAQAILSDTVVNVRRYCRDLRPSLLDDLGLVDAVDWLVGDLRARTDLRVNLETAGFAHRLDEKVELLIFRVVQEALHNVEQHAHASEVQVGLTFTVESLVASVSDDGRGMKGANGRTVSGQLAPGLGLRGMEERAKLLGGVLTIAAGRSGGTEVTLAVPLEPSGGDPRA